MSSATDSVGWSPSALKVSVNVGPPKPPVGARWVVALKSPKSLSASE